MNQEPFKAPAIELYLQPTENSLSSTIQGQDLLNNTFLENHDIFHALCEADTFKKKYKEAFYSSMHEFESYSFHGEGLIELFSRFFGNCKSELVSYGNQKYIQLPVKQPGVRENQPYRVFPIHEKMRWVGYRPEQYQQEFLSCVRYTVIGSLVSGNIIDDFIRDFCDYLPEKKKSRDYYKSKEFIYEIHRYLSQEGELSKESKILNEYLNTHYKSSFELTKAAIVQYIDFFYDQVIDINNIKPIITSKNINIPIFKENTTTLLGEAYFQQDAVKKASDYYGYSTL